MYATQFGEFCIILNASVIHVEIGHNMPYLEKFPSSFVS